MAFSFMHVLKQYLIKYQLPLFLILLLVFSLVFSKKINSVIIIVLSSLWLLGGDYKAKWQDVKNNKVIILVLFYLINIFGLLYTANLSVGLGVLTKRASLLLLPLAFVYFIDKKEQIERIKIGFILTCLLAVSYSLGALYYWYLTDSEAFLAEFYRYYNYDFYRRFLCIPIGLHPTYFSIFLLFGVLLLLEKMIENIQNKKFFYFISWFLGSLYLLVFAFLLASRMPLVAFFVVILVAVFAWIIKKRYLLLFPVIFFFFGLGIYKVYHHPILSQRFVEIKNTPWQPPVGIYHNSTNIRIGLLVCTFEEVKKHFILGTGTGDMQDQLNDCYARKEFSSVLYEFNYNTHNAFLDAQLMLGVLGLGALLFMVFYCFRLAFNTHNYIYAAFLLFWCVCGLSESLLNTQKGIIFFAIFNSLFYVASSKKLVSRYAS